ncbi:hypothetical protein [Domibacillus robiginosus]|uniref:hypothetical protein n=1 Tax=Domibacillus robiginosus TaxID=1071054 RepID=UPI00067C425E|nr:hypothetical protein [Domibacillus robiginosus]
MNLSKQHTGLYDVASFLTFAGLALLVSLYVCLLQPDIYAYILPVFAAFLLTSIRSFTLHHKIFCREETDVAQAAFFYKGCMIMYFAFSLYLLNISFIFFTVYSHGGYLVVWSCTPLSLLCFFMCLQAEKALTNVSLNKTSINTDAI